MTHGAFVTGFRGTVQKLVNALALWGNDMVAAPFGGGSHLRAFLWLGELVEQGPAEQFFAAPQHPITQDYLERRIG